MRRTTMILAAAAGVTLAGGCAGSPRQVAGQAAPEGAASPAPSITESAPSSPPRSTPPTTSPATLDPEPSTKTRTRTKSSSPPKRSVTRVVGPADVLGPTGLGRLQIGMTTEEAEATGMVEAGEGERGCGSWYLKPDVNGDATVGWSSRGVVSIAAYDDVATPEGIRIGSTLAQAERAYDDLTGIATDKDGGSWGDGPAIAGERDRYGSVHYRFLFVDGAVVKLSLEHDQPSC